MRRVFKQASTFESMPPVTHIRLEVRQAEVEEVESGCDLGIGPLHQRHVEGVNGAVVLVDGPVPRDLGPHPHGIGDALPRPRSVWMTGGSREERETTYGSLPRTKLTSLILLILLVTN